MTIYEKTYSPEIKVMVLTSHERHWRVVAEIKTKHFPVKIYVEALWVEGDFPQTDTIASELVDDLEPLFQELNFIYQTVNFFSSWRQLRQDPDPEIFIRMEKIKKYSGLINDKYDSKKMKMQLCTDSLPHLALAIRYVSPESI